jgi:uncharacterized protein (TIGR03067 family)
MNACLLLAALPLSVTADAPKDAPAALQGTWKLESVEIDGMAIDLLDFHPRWIIKGNKILYAGSDLATLTIDESTTPKCFDMAYVKQKKSFEGIYSIDGDTLKVCVNKQSDGQKERPLDFSTEV